MPVADPTLSWWMPLLALAGIAFVAFLVPWVLTDVAHVPRALYLASLMIVTAALTWGYLAWSGRDMVAFMTHHWVWGLLGAVVSGAITARGVIAATKRAGAPRPTPRTSRERVGGVVWEGLLYGAAEGVLLSVLPVLAAWQAFDLLGWTSTAAGAIGSGLIALVASAMVISVHHLGYREFRGTREIVFPNVACGLLSLAYLLTGSPIAPTGGHFLLHLGIEASGAEMPP